jgi:hypothetical protein
MPVKMIDPPSGWKYGFPKALPDPEPDDLIEWLVASGYPKESIDQLGKHFFFRMWEEE